MSKKETCNKVQYKELARSQSIPHPRQERLVTSKGKKQPFTKTAKTPPY